MRRAAYAASQVGEVRGAVGLRVDRPAHLAHQRYRRVVRLEPARVAAPARAEPRGLRGLRDREEPHLSTSRAPAGAGGAAENSRRPDRVHEVAVEAAVAVEHDLPLAGGIE